MNKAQQIYFSTGNTGNSDSDKYIKVKLEQNVDTLEFLSMTIRTEEAYQNFNSDYGVLVGRVLANGSVGIPNAKISIFIPLTDDDAEDSDIYSVYPYKTPRDKNNEGKRYNLLPRVSQLEKSTGTNKPKQPFGSFPIKPELVVNETYLNVYRKYYKYTAVSNEYGDYMIFGVPVGTQTVHLSVDITDIGKYSMTPASMIKAGYSSNLFTENGNSIKLSNDLNDLPNIETQEIAVDVIPFWGDAENFMIGITQQNFRIKAILSSDFVIFGTTMSMGFWGLYGSSYRGDSDNYALYTLDVQNYSSDSYNNNADIRTYRSVPPIIRVFTYTNDVAINLDNRMTINLPPNTNFDQQIRELDKSEYFEYNVDGNFMLTIPCNRDRIITGDDGSDIIIEDESPFGIFTKFFGMILIEYPDFNSLPINQTATQYKSRARFKIPQSVGLNEEIFYDSKYNDKWRMEYQAFTGGGIYSVAQFHPMKAAYGTHNNFIDFSPNHENTFTYDITSTGGSWFKVGGDNIIIQKESIDEQNYLINSTKYSYDFSPNITGANYVGHDRYLDDVGDDKHLMYNGNLFGGQWLNLCITFTAYGWNDWYNTYHKYHVADIYHNQYYNINNRRYGVIDNNQKLFANIVNTKNYVKGDAFQTAFINIPKTELIKLYQIPYKGINVRRWNNKTMDNLIKGDISTLNISPLTANPYKYLKPKSSYINTPSNEVTNGRQYNMFGYDGYYSSYNPVPSDEKNASAYLFKGMYGNDCIAMLFDFGII